MQFNEVFYFWATFRVIRYEKFDFKLVFLRKDGQYTKGKIQGAGGNNQKWNVKAEYFLSLKS